MKDKPTRRRRLRLFLFIFIPLIIIAAGLAFVFSGVNTFLKPTITKMISRIIVDGSDSLYSFSLRDYAIGPGGRTVVIEDLRIAVDSSHYYRLKERGLLPSLIFSLDVDKASVTGLNPIDLYKHKKIICRTIGIENAKVSFLQQMKRKDSLPDAPQKTLYELIQPDINLIDVEKLVIKNADVLFKTVAHQTSKKDSWHFENTSMEMDHIKVDSNSHADTARAWYADNIHVKLGKFMTRESGALYNFSIAATEYDFKKRTATLDSVKILPAISNAAFNKRMGHEADQFSVVIPKLELEEFNAAAFIVENYIEAGSAKISNPVISLYKDRNAGLDTRSKVGEYPHQLLLKAAPLIDIKKINIQGGSLTVTQKSQKTQLEGHFTFRGIHGNITNVTNNSTVIANDKWCKANLSANFMGGNPMNALFSFDLGSNNGHFIVDASLKSMQASQLNNMLRALAGAKMESFTLDKLQYHVEGYDHYTVGDLRLLYHDLKLSVLKDDGEGGYEKKGLMSLLANMLKLYNDNPMPGKEERKAVNIRDPRTPRKNFFGQVCQTLLKCAQEIAVKGDNKNLPGVGGGGDNKKEKKKFQLFKKKK
jgi:hypothetical protein